jgi:hypothetical protein
MGPPRLRPEAATDSRPSPVCGEVRVDAPLVRVEPEVGGVSLLRRLPARGVLLRRRRSTIGGFIGGAQRLVLGDGDAPAAPERTTDVRLREQAWLCVTGVLVGQLS